MPNIKSAKKRVALSKAAYEKNKADKSELKTAVRSSKPLWPPATASRPTAPTRPPSSPLTRA